ncbi:MAG: nucleotide exchange factor GrpE [Chloroflexota bacterium]|nr:nucleotide exchange factor GrpE [Chloroflexota bacterium]
MNADAHDSEAAAGSEREAELEAEVAALNDQLLRQRAEMDNFRKRVNRTTDDLIQQAKSSLLGDILSVADDLDRTLAALDSGSDPRSAREGVQLTRNRLEALLQARGVRVIDTDGVFDPRWHEAVAARPSSDLPAGTITAEVQAGYRWGDDVLRAARVEVAVADDGM